MSVAGAITYLISGYFDLAPFLGVSGGCVAGGVAGALLLKKLPSGAVGVAFSLIMIGVAVTDFFRRLNRNPPVKTLYGGVVAGARLS